MDIILYIIIGLLVILFPISIIGSNKVYKKKIQDKETAILKNKEDNKFYINALLRMIKTYPEWIKLIEEKIKPEWKYKVLLQSAYVYMNGDTWAYDIYLKTINNLKNNISFLDNKIYFWDISIDYENPSNSRYHILYDFSLGNVVDINYIITDKEKDTGKLWVSFKDMRVKEYTLTNITYAYNFLKLKTTAYKKHLKENKDTEIPPYEPITTKNPNWNSIFTSLGLNIDEQKTK